MSTASKVREHRLFPALRQAHEEKRDEDALRLQAEIRYELTCSAQAVRDALRRTKVRGRPRTQAEPPSQLATEGLRQLAALAAVADPRMCGDARVAAALDWIVSLPV